MKAKNKKTGNKQLHVRTNTLISEPNSSSQLTPPTAADL